MEVECECCQETIDLDSAELPSDASSETEIECPHCGSLLSVGWYAVAEVRGVIHNECS